MSELLELAASSRKNPSKAATKALKKNGMIPAIINDSKGTSTNISVESHGLDIAHQKGELISSVFNIKIDDRKAQKVFVKDVQQHCVTDKLQHIDFQKAGTKNKVKVFIYFINTESSPGIKKGGFINIIHRYIWCICPKNDLIRHVDVDLSEKTVGEFIRIKDLPLPKIIKSVITDLNTPIANIVGKKGQAKESSDNTENSKENNK
ncbi:50S ribosomal protein L25 [Candidatus Xenohaliotis californiensis]|uniref:Large ribosomal subunit protein bL25 n=1 Tax=Candidatus Xenohaliotis californiensis TaxID=84677 RepID=A0ABP0EVP4_9RICK|nr:50S ribosomal protein L25 [Candidatus Xenohaliotis californiensis]